MLAHSYTFFQYQIGGVQPPFYIAKSSKWKKKKKTESKLVCVEHKDIFMIIIKYKVDCKSPMFVYLKVASLYNSHRVG